MCLALTFIILSWVHMPDRQQCVSSLQCLLLFVHIRPLFNFADKRSVSVMDRTTYWYIFCVCFRIWHLAWSLSGSHCWLKVVTSICTCFTPHIHHSVSVLRMTKTPIPVLVCSVVLNPFVTMSGTSFCLANLGQAYSTPCRSLAFRSWGSDTTFRWGAHVQGVDANSRKYESSVTELHVRGVPHQFIPPNRPHCHSDGQAFPSKMQTYRQVLIFTVKITVPVSAILWTWFRSTPVHAFKTKRSVLR